MSMNPPVPPPLRTASAKQANRRMKILVLVLSACLLFALFIMVLPAVFGISLMTSLIDETRIKITSDSDKFQVTVLEVKAQPGYFAERVRVSCDKDMEVGIWVSDLKETGLFETNGARGELIYREGHPHKLGQSETIHSDGKPSTCEVFFKINTTSNRTSWHSEVAGGSADTSLPVLLTASDVQTNWPSAYARGTEIPLANLGDYKVLLSLK